MARIQRKVAATAGRTTRQAAEPAAEVQRTRRKVPLKHVTRFTRMLATLTEAGLPVLRNLRILADQWPTGRFRDSIEGAAEMVEEGQPLSEALGQSPGVFDELYVNMVKAGEAGGVLDVVLERLAEFQEKSQELRQRTRGAMVYPMVIVVVAFAVIAALMLLVIPKFDELFQEMGLPLPGLTLGLIAVSQHVTLYWYIYIGMPILLTILFQMAYLRSYGFRRWNHAVHLRLPVIGGLVKLSQVSRFSTTFGTLVASGVPHLRAFDIVRGALSSEVFREAIEEVREEVREGEGIAASLEQTGCFDQITVSMVEVGEETGELDRMCLRVGAAFEDRYRRALDIALKLLEPIMLVLMAAVVGVIALALFLPLFELLKQFGQNG